MNSAKEEVSSQAIATELERLCESATFRNSPRLCRFLRYTVESAMRGEGEKLKEYVIGTDVYDRRHPYYPSQDSIVRTEAKRLRNKLKEYYDTEGLEDEVLIYYRTGNYQPIFRRSERRSDTTKMPAEKTAAAPNETSPGVTIAVLPFRHQKGDSEAAAIAAGITDDLIFLITSTDGCRVMASQSVALVHSRTSDVALLSSVLNVDQVITGSVRKDATHVRVSVTGVHPSGLETWSERFDFTTNKNDLMILEEQTASAIMARIGPHESVLRHMQARVPTVCLSTFPEILSAEAAMDQGTSASLRSAIFKFKNLAARQPQSARIQCGMTQCYYSLALLGERLTPEELQEAKIAAVRALQLDPEMGEAHAAMGCSHLLELNGEGAEEAFRHALTLRESPNIRQAYADQLMTLGRFEDAAIQLTNSRRVDPFSHRQRVSTARLRYLTWHPNDEPDVLREEIQYGPAPTQVLLFEAELLLRKGREADAANLADTILRNSDPSSAMLSDLAAILALAGLTDKARELVDRFQLLSQDALVSSTYQARLCMALRDREACRSFLKVAVAQQEPQLCWLAIDPKLQDLRGDSIISHANQVSRGPGTGWANS
ncbi:Adenylate cyclase [Acidisarcina polymorpha]|uniref:Adenylate cyclase n=1 Tax=Acidisarcina polymorpha TaxID=2211140 RepID=A0A2Z5FYT4_9BACT|nr:hypothetical protein [Acidisarcina polymorpha]AXC12008.1 Adenylate cyclase [Acidisarcina polymorpha]